MSSLAPLLSPKEVDRMASRDDDNEQQLPTEQEGENDPVIPLVRTSSIFSSTLNEIQNTVCEPGKPFGSMNMDELLTNIWSAEEGPTGLVATSSNAAAKVASSQPIRRQATLSLPGPLSAKTVDEVWAEIHRVEGDSNAGSGGGKRPLKYLNDDSGGSTPVRQLTFGDMTLEDFLVKAGVVREGMPSTPRPVSQVMPVTPWYDAAPSTPRPVSQVMPATPRYDVAGFKTPMTVGKVEGFGHFGDGAPFGGMFGSPSSPESPETLEDKLRPFGMNYGGYGFERRGRKFERGGRKREADGDDKVELVVDRRHRRMIKNRESAARSRARKQAYTVELETELKQLKEENARLKEEEETKVSILRKKLLVDAIAEQSRINLRKKVGMLRRCSTA